MLISVAVLSLPGHAQKLKLDSFEQTMETSALQNPVYDNNNVKCALVKVGIIAENPRFEGVMSFEKKDGEYWVYIPDTFDQFMVKTDNFVPFICNFESVKSAFTYRAIIIPDDGKAIEETKPTTPGETADSMVVAIPGTDLSFTMIKVNPGMFEMGATPEQNSKEGDEKPVHRVIIRKPFYMGKTEVTQDVWEAVMGSNPSVFIDPAKPVDNISWLDAQQFINKLNTLTGQNFDLPTEAQWEYAARGGHLGALHRFSGSDDSQEVGWSNLNSMKRTHEVGKLKPNELGLYDMSGNVWELCRDFKKEYSKGTVTDPEETEGKDRVRRGGAWNSSEDQLRNAYRRRAPEDVVSLDTGLRLILE